MTKNERIAELERRIAALETELANLRGQPMLVYGRVPHPMIPAQEPADWAVAPGSTGTPLPQSIIIVSKAADVEATRHAVALTFGFPSVGEPDGTITSLL